MSYELRAASFEAFQTLTDYWEQIGSGFNDALLFLDHLNDIPFRVMDLKVPCALTVAVDWAWSNSARVEYVSHSFDLLTEENWSLACTCSFFCGEDNEVSIPFEMEDCGSRFLLNIGGFTKPELFLIPRTHGRNISNRDSQSSWDGKICRLPWNVQPSGCRCDSFYSVAMGDPKPCRPTRVKRSAHNETQVFMRTINIDENEGW